LAILNGVVSIGQIFIFLTITWYSSLVTTTITTTRKFFTILFSVLHFGHSFSFGQWTSVAMVFGGLYISIASGNKTTTTSTSKKSKTE
jgi:drug/metabolite transporter (DMT)-like permease